MTSIHFDFSPKGGPADLVGKWAPAPARSITWPDGNAWTKAPTAAAEPSSLAVAVEPAARPRGGMSFFGLGVLAAVAAAALAYAQRERVHKTFEARATRMAEI